MLCLHFSIQYPILKVRKMTVKFMFIFSLVALNSVHQTFQFVKGRKKILSLIVLQSDALHVEFCLTIEGLYNIH